ncbi:MAG TPA: phasin family protein [Alphaproteobacteria bacterium]|nr:phasin family protein [Alphaproteobacteria bacterium]
MNDTMQKTMTQAANEAKAQFDTFTKSFESFMGQDGAKKVAETSAENLRAASESVQAVVGELEQINASLAQHMAKTMTHAFETQAKMLTAGGWQQAMEIQNAYMNETMDSSFAELSRLTDRGTNMMTKASAPIQSRLDAMMKNA